MQLFGKRKCSHGKMANDLFIHLTSRVLWGSNKQRCRLQSRKYDLFRKFCVTISHLNVLNLFFPFKVCDKSWLSCVWKNSCQKLLHIILFIRLEFKKHKEYHKRKKKKKKGRRKLKSAFFKTSKNYKNTFFSFRY